MPIHPIVLSDNPLIREKSHHVHSVDSDVRQLIDDMIETMEAADGIGLAAIQIGITERVIVVQVPEYEPEHETKDEDEETPVSFKRYAIVNPELARTSREMEPGIEGCLSIPGWVGEVPRHSAVTVKGLDAQGRRVRIKARGLLARVLQHEIDHCDGVLFIDHIEDPEKIWAVPEGEEEAAEAAQEVPGDGAPSGPAV